MRLRLGGRVPAAALIVACLLAGLPARRAEAHPNSVQSEPAANAVLGESPARVQVWFDEAIEPAFGHLEVFDSDGRRVDNLDTAYVEDGGPSLVVTLPPLPKGTYIATWRVTAVGDAHTVGGAFAFGVGEAVSGLALPETESGLDHAAAALRWMGLLAQGILFGGVVFRGTVWRRVVGDQSAEAVSALNASYERRMILAADILRAALVVGTAGTLFYQAREAGQPVLALLGAQWGRIWTLRMLLVLGLSGFMTHLLTASRVPWVGSAALAGLLATTSLVSHGASAGAPLLAVADWVHLISTSVWAGGVMVYAFIARPALGILSGDERGRAESRAHAEFSWLAAAGVGGTLISGAALAVGHIGQWEALFLTRYGTAFQFKLAVVLAALLLGAANLISRGTRTLNSRGLFRFGGRLGSEAVILTGVFIASALLVGLPRGLNAAREAGAEAVRLESGAHPTRVEVEINPARIGGIQQFRFRFGGPDQATFQAAESVEIKFVPVGGGGLSATVPASPQGDGSYHVSGHYLTREGDWQMLVVEMLPSGEARFQTVDVRVDPDGVVRSPLESLPLPALFLGWLATYGRAGIIGSLLTFAAAWAWLAWRAAPSGNRTAFAGLLAPSALAVAAAWVIGLGAFGR